MKAGLLRNGILSALAWVSICIAPACPVFAQEDSAGAVSPQQFGAKADGSTNDTSAVQAAIHAAMARPGYGCVALSGIYRVGSVKIQRAHGLHVIGQGACLVGLKEGAFPAVLEISNSSDVSITGKLEVSAQYNPNYEAGIWVYGDGGRGNNASNMQFFDVSVSSVKAAWRFGSRSVPLAQVSEIAVHGGHTYGCSNVIEVIGYETVANFIGYNIISGEGEKGQWESQTENTVRVVAGSLTITGGEVQHNADSKGALIFLEPGAAEHGRMSYGNVYISNAEIETAAPLAVTANPGRLDAPDTGVINVHNCFGYHSQDLGPFVTTDPMYSGWLVMKENNFYAGKKRSHPNIAASNATKIDVDVKSFGKNFMPGRAGISGGCFPESGCAAAETH